jgi:hypothetical protein
MLVKKIINQPWCFREEQKLLGTCAFGSHTRKRGTWCFGKTSHALDLVLSGPTQKSENASAFTTGF